MAASKKNKEEEEKKDDFLFGFFRFFLLIFEIKKFSRSENERETSTSPDAARIA